MQGIQNVFQTDEKVWILTKIVQKTGKTMENDEDKYKYQLNENLHTLFISKQIFQHFHFDECVGVVMENNMENCDFGLEKFMTPEDLQP